MNLGNKSMLSTDVRAGHRAHSEISARLFHAGYIARIKIDALRAQDQFLSFQLALIEGGPVRMASLRDWNGSFARAGPGARTALYRP